MHSRIYLPLFALALFPAGCLLAQTSPRAALPVASQPAAHSSSRVAPAEALPQISGLQRLQLENLQLKFQLLQQQQQQLQSSYAELIQQIQSEHPGFRWDSATASLIAIPAPAKPTDGKKEK